MNWRERLREINETVADAKETTAEMSDTELVRGGAVVLQELMDAQHQHNLLLHEWKVWWAEAARRDLLNDIMERMRENRE